VYAVSFSPDGQRLAAVVGESVQRESLLFANVANPRTNGVKYEARTQIDDLDIGVPPISWSPSGDAIALGSFVYTPGGRTCELPPSPFLFFGANSAAGLDAALIRYHTAKAPSHLLFFSSDCQDAGTLEVPYGRYIADASADRGLLCLLPFGAQPPKPEPLEVLVVSPSDRSVVHRWTKDVMNVGVLFADTGKALCGLAGTEKHGTAHCWSVDTGKEIAATTGNNIHQPMRTALYAQRAVLSHYGWGIDFEGFSARMGSLKERIIWDFRTGRELASWTPKWQRDGSAIVPREPYKFAISPDGNYVVEGGDGVLTLYKIEP
jgi:WD40 repeat protein